MKKKLLLKYKICKGKVKNYCFLKIYNMSNYKK